MKLITLTCLLASIVAISSATFDNYAEAFGSPMQEDSASDFGDYPLASARSEHSRGRNLCPKRTRKKCCSLRFALTRAGYPRVVAPMCSEDEMLACCTSLRADTSSLGVIITCIESLIGNLAEFKFKIPRECCNISVFKYTCKGD